MHSHIRLRPGSAFPNTAYPASSWQSPALTHTSLTPRGHGSRITAGRCLYSHIRQANNPMFPRDLASVLHPISLIISSVLYPPPLPPCTVPSILSPLHAQPPSSVLPEAPQPPSLPIPVLHHASPTPPCLSAAASGMRKDAGRVLICAVMSRVSLTAAEKTG